MFSVRQKREIAEKVQQILRETGHPELPAGEIRFLLHVDGAEAWSWADIRNNGAVTSPGVNPHNEAQDKGHNVEVDGPRQAQLAEGPRRTECSAAGDSEKG